MSDIFGYTWDEIQQMQRKEYNRPVVKQQTGDYGCDPLPDGTFRMVPSGDVVDTKERDRRLGW